MDAPATILEAAAALRARTLSSAELVDHCLARADALDPVLGVYVERFDEPARAAARQADAELAAGEDRGPLHGIPIGLKDIIAAREGPTTGNSEVVYPQWQRPHDATVVTRLRDAGAVVCGKLTTMEFALGIHDPDKRFPLPRNPWDPTRWPGGSSSGSGAGVAAGLFLGALGSDTGGSVRLPASYCGITGLKQTYGRGSKAGVIPCGPSLDVVGPMTRTAADAAAMLQAIAGHDPADPTTADVAVPDFSARLGAPLDGLRIGVERANHLTGEQIQPGMPEVFEAAVAELEAAGATVVDVEMAHYAQLVGATLVTFFTEALAVHRQALREQWDAFGAPARLALASNACFGADDYVASQQVRRVCRVAVDRLLEDVDVIVCPSTSTTAPVADGFDLAGLQATLFTVAWSGIGHPTVSIPMGFDAAGLPYGLQVAGRMFDEATVLGVAAAYQARTDWHARRIPELAGG